jgi:holo-[acyl-carrier protein] synthase
MGQRTSIRVGADITRVSDVAASIDHFGDRYVHRLFTEHEIATTRADPAHLAGRFAAKEAAIKVLRPIGARPEWRAIEVRRCASGACDLVLSGTAALLAAEAGITSLAVSLTYERDIAAAVVIATLIDERAVA